MVMRSQQQKHPCEDIPYLGLSLSNELANTNLLAQCFLVRSYNSQAAAKTPTQVTTKMAKIRVHPLINEEKKQEVLQKEARP